MEFKIERTLVHDGPPCNGAYLGNDDEWYINVLTIRDLHSIQMEVGVPIELNIDPSLEKPMWIIIYG